MSNWTAKKPISGYLEKRIFCIHGRDVCLSWSLAREKFFSPKYSGLRGKIHFISKGIGIILSLMPYATTMRRTIQRISKYTISCSRKLHTNNPQKKEIFFFLPNGLGDAIINKYFIDRIMKRGYKNCDILILASDAWKDFKSILFPNVTVHFFNIELFEMSFSYRKKIYKLLWKYSFRFAVCNLKWKNPYIFEKIMSHVNSDNKYACLYQERCGRLNDELNVWSSYFAVDIYDNGQYIHEIQRIANFYTHIGLLDNNWIQRPCLPRPVNSECSKLAPYIVFHIGNWDKRRRWNIQKFNAVGHVLVRKGFSIFFCGGTQERDLIPFIDKEFKQYIGVLSAEEYAELISCSFLLLSGDTGPAHLALALNVPAVIILGGGHYKNYFPYPDNITPKLKSVSYISKKMECFGCDWECIFSDERRFSCIHGISSDDVINTLNNAIKNHRCIDKWEI